MTEKLVDMATEVVDEKTGGVTLRVTKRKVKSVTAKIRNADPQRTGHTFSDVLAGSVHFRPGEIKRLEVSEALVAELQAQPKGTGTFQLTDKSVRPGRPIEEPEDEVEEEGVTTTRDVEPVTVKKPAPKVVTNFLPEEEDDEPSEEEATPPSKEAATRVQRVQRAQRKRA